MMARQGFAMQAQRNRSLAGLFLVSYIASFFVFTLLILSPLPVIYGQSGRSIFLDPLQYLSDYWPIGLFAPVAAFAWNRYTFARELRELLAIRPLAPSSERRLGIAADAQASLQGLRRPDLGLIDTPARNALTVGAIGAKPMIVVTRGLLDALDDDELAAVLAHEIAHWRLGDTRLLTINQVLMRTAIALQAINPFKMERHPHHRFQWHIAFGIFYPYFLVLLFVGGSLTMAMWTLARLANRKVRTGRDLIADGEAIRMTHFPEALESAIYKCNGQGWFEHAERFEAMLFEGASVSEGGTHPDAVERIEILRQNAGDLYAPGRVRADSRPYDQDLPEPVPANGSGRRRTFGRKRSAGFAAANATRPEAEEWTLARGMAFWTDPDAHRKWRRRELDLYTWRVEDDRDVFGVAKDMRLLAYGALCLSLVGASLVTDNRSEYLSYVSGKSYLLQADDHFADFKCSFTGKSLEECEEQRTGTQAA